MHKEGYYSSGEFAKKANVTVRTIRYYDKQNILKPSLLTEDGVRFYTDSDFTRLQQILLFKYLGFSLEDIRNMTIGDSDYNILLNSLNLQFKLIQDKIAQMELVKNAIEDTIDTFKNNKSVDWSNMLSLIHLTNMESTLKTQYLNAGNITARINLHAEYSVNKQGWFNWIYEQSNIQTGQRILEIGCGDGRLWVDNKNNVRELSGLQVFLSDISDGMVNDARRNIEAEYASENGADSTAHKNKVIMLTDFKDSMNFEMLKEELDDASLQGTDPYLGNIVMTANYILGRKKSELAGEDEDLYIPASGALAGRMSNTEETVIAQAAAGKRYGTLDNVKGARMDLRKSEIAALIDLGVIPMVEEDGRTMAFSNHTLYNGASKGLQEYSIVRVFDWIGKVFENYCNDHAMEIWTPAIKSEITQDIHSFLSDYKGPGGIIEKYTNLKVDQDPKTKDISINVEITPYFAAQNFFIELTGRNSAAGVDWEQSTKNA